MHRVVLTTILSLAALQAQEYTRGVGVYPGDPKQSWSPVLEPGSNQYRNLALHRPAYQSSSYDYSLTAQLVTDGIRETVMPRRIAVTGSQQGLLKKDERDRILDNNWMTTTDQRGKSVWLQVEIAGGASAPVIDALQVDGSVRAAQPENQEVTCTVSGSSDGQAWHELGRDAHMVHPVGELHAMISFQAPSRNRFYRVQFDNGRPLQWTVGEFKFLNKNRQVHVGGPFDFSSAWMSAGTGEEWVYVDLGARSQFDRVVMDWIRRPAEGVLQVSDDARNWTTLQPLNADEVKLSQPAEARYVRVLMTRAATLEGYVLSELEVWGHGGMVARPKPAAPAPALAGGGWKVQRDSQVKAPGEALSQAGFDDRDWVVATVPGTVLTSYLQCRRGPGPEFRRQPVHDLRIVLLRRFLVSRRIHAAGGGSRPDTLWLNFDGHQLEGGGLPQWRETGPHRRRVHARRASTSPGCCRPARKSALAVRVRRTPRPAAFKEKTFESPDKNGGALGADNPTFHASIGWDWIPTIRGRDTGIWNNVFLTVTGPVTIENPWVDTTLPLPDTSRADVADRSYARKITKRGP